MSGSYQAIIKMDSKPIICNNFIGLDCIKIGAFYFISEVITKYKRLI